jgi:DNA-binding response OmpR family regulator
MNSISMIGKILYVEDDEINAFLMRRYLNKWDVDLASDAETGLLLAEQELYKVILLDINLGDSKMSY